MNTRSRNPQPGQEMTNLGADPFMTNNLGGLASRPQISVRILKATGLPEPRSGNVATQGKVVVQSDAASMSNSMLTTNESPDPVSPVWNTMSGTRMRNWVPGRNLIFQIMRKDRSGCMPGLTAQPELIAQAVLPFDQFFPWGVGMSGWGDDNWLPLVSPNGRPIDGAYVYIQVECLNVGAVGWGAKLQRECCGRLSLRQIGDTIKHLPENCVRMAREVLGEPADDRNKSDLFMLVFVPYCVFLFITWLGWLLYHFCSIAMFFVIAVAACVSAGLILAAITVQKKSKKPLFALGVLLLIATILGGVVSNGGWNDSWQQWWWMQTGRKVGATAGTPAEARNDAAFINFATVKNGTAWTSVDATRAAGYRHGDIYCVAPILDPTVALGDIMRVEYWAIGINCCDDFGSFTCDQAREFRGGGTGVVMKGHGMPCDGCHEEKFRLAAAKSAGVNKMVSAPGALFVRYVSSGKSIEHLYLAKCVLSFFWSLLLGLFVFGVLGFVTNYKGWGKRGRFPLYNSLDEPIKKPARDQPVTQAAQQPVAAPQVKEWNMILTQTPNGQISMAATGPEDNYYGAI